MKNCEYCNSLANDEQLRCESCGAPFTKKVSTGPMFNFPSSPENYELIAKAIEKRFQTYSALVR